MMDEVLCNFKSSTDGMWSELSNKLHSRLDESVTVPGLRLETKIEASLLQASKAHELAVATQLRDMASQTASQIQAIGEVAQKALAQSWQS
ncbi:MAG: hypothetical protein ACKPKO_45715, partial [Candidatus Fonsibacter sp.]